MKASEVVFPVTLEAFCAIQESLAGRPETDFEQEFFAIAVEIINGEFDSGRRGEDALNFDGMLETAISETKCKDRLRRFSKAFKAWCDLAYVRGLQERSKTHA